MPSSEVSFRFLAEMGIADRPRPVYTLCAMTAEALLAELEDRDTLKPWDRTPALPPARSDRPDLPGPRSLSYTHLDCIDFIIQNPTITQNALALRYGYTPSWMSLVMSSDAFQAELAKRRDEVLSPEIRTSVEERFRALVVKSQDTLLEAMHTKPNPALALEILTTASRALGYGARDTNVNIAASFVVALPPAAESSEAWSKGRTIDNPPQQPVGLPSGPESK